jgi:hypothetical protein
VIKLDPPRITGQDLYEQMQQLISYQRMLTQQLNMELNRELDELRQQKEE